MCKALYSKASEEWPLGPRFQAGLWHRIISIISDVTSVAACGVVDHKLYTDCTGTML